MGVLGTGHNEAWIYRKGGTIPVKKIKDPESLEWNRELNAISEASVEIKTGTHAQCCSLYGQLGTWGFELVMFRDGVRSWEGPLTNIRWRRGGVSLIAKDVLGWGARKSTPNRLVTIPAYAEAEGWNDMNATFATHDPNVIAHMQRLAPNSGPTVTRDVKLYGGYFADQLTELAKGGLMFTTVGRRILVWHADYMMGKTATLLPDHLSGEIEVEEDGMALATDTIAINDDGVYGVYYPGVDPFYGQVEQIVSSDGTDTASLNTMAATYNAQYYPAPLSVNVPQDSVLSCDAPFAMEELVAGAVVPVKVEGGICKTVLATQQLQSVKVSEGSEGEKVSITVAPASTLVSS